MSEILLKPKKFLELCTHGSTAIRNILTLTVRGSTLVYRRQILTKVDPRAVSVKAQIYIMSGLTHLKLCLALAAHNLKWLKNTSRFA